MEQEFLDWYKANKKRFAHGQFDERQIAYAAYIEGARRKALIKAQSIGPCPSCNDTKIMDSGNYCDECE